MDKLVLIYYFMDRHLAISSSRSRLDSYRLMVLLQISSVYSHPGGTFTASSYSGQISCLSSLSLKKKEFLKNAFLIAAAKNLCFRAIGKKCWDWIVWKFNGHHYYAYFVVSYWSRKGSGQANIYKLCCLRYINQRLTKNIRMWQGMYLLFFLLWIFYNYASSMLLSSFWNTWKCSNSNN